MAQKKWKIVEFRSNESGLPQEFPFSGDKIIGDSFVYEYTRIRDEGRISRQPDVLYYQRKLLNIWMVTGPIYVQKLLRLRDGDLKIFSLSLSPFIFDLTFPLECMM